MVFFFSCASVDRALRYEASYVALFLRVWMRCERGHLNEADLY